MEIIKKEQLDILSASGSSVALGTFDGVHMGHREILRKAKENAGGMPVVCFTFENIPASLFDAGKKPLYTTEEKLATLEEMGVDYVYMPKFTREFASQSTDEFLNFLRDKLYARALSFGFNYTFGYKAEGNAQTMCEYAEKNGIKASALSGVEFEGETVSSTRIRELLAMGEVSLANILLKKPFCLKGEVVKGKQLGREIGFPTANFNYPEKTELKRGVYVSRVYIGEKDYPAITNVGVRPTVENTEKINVETNILGFVGNLYGKMLEVEIYDFLRDERRFSGIDELVKQLETDKKIALQYNFSMLQ